jgi:4-hydroxy-tetrahydrodipicolinate synthase
VPGLRYTRSEAKSYAREHMKGLWAAIPYPFTTDLELDEAGLRSNLRHFADALKIDGVFTGGLVGEYWSLTKEERKRALEIVVDECRGKMQVMAHTGHSSAKEAIELTRHAELVGADYAIVINPYPIVRTDAMARAFYEYLCAGVEIGVSLFNSSVGGFTLSPKLVAELAEIENVIAIKNAQPPSHTMEVRHLAADRIVVMDPNEENWLVSHGTFGQQALNSEPTVFLYQTAAHQPIREYTELLDRQRTAEALAIHHRLWPVREIYKRWIGGPWERHGIVNIQVVKAWLELQGLAGGPVRPPLVQVTESEREQLRQELLAVGFATVGKPLAIA